MPRPRPVRPVVALLAVVALLLGAAPALRAAGVEDLALTFTPADTDAHYNVGVSIKLTATWASGTPPYGASFKANDIVVGNVNTSQKTAVLGISGAILQEGPNPFAVDVVETSVPNAVTKSANAPGSLVIDKTAPGVTVKITAGQVVSPIAGYNVVKFTVQSSEPMPDAPTLSITPGSGFNPTPENNPTYPTTAVQYTLTVPNDTPGGAYTIRAVCRDDTLPAESRNTGVGQDAFTVDSTADTAPTLTTLKPPSPARVTTVTVSGGVPSETAAQKVQVFVDGTEKANTSVAANVTSFSVTLTDLTAGSHKITARRQDPLGNISPDSVPLNLIIDQTPPAVPTISATKTPTNQPRIRLAGTGAIDPAPESKPIRVVLLKAGVEIASAAANSDGSWSFEEVALSDGPNLLQVLAADTTWDDAGSAGNRSGFSAPMIVTLDTKPPSVVGGGIVISSEQVQALRADLALYLAGRLPPAREEWLLYGVREGLLGERALPTAANVTGSGTRRLRELLLFREMHEGGAPR